ncbi:hypothetical protein [Rheinheimera soli]|uniref:hypothetical protein n=1 Tax=Rheinheimera soli TaxID=443616 RepID=UPI001E32EC47|nr:hypothetical protein [Rheinheimera soli]
MKFEHLFKKLGDMELTLDEALHYCSKENIGFVEFCNDVMVTTATQYYEKKIDYPFADAVANNVYGFMVSDHYLGLTGNSLSEPAYSVYLAFDSGEYFHQNDDRSIEPELKYTRPEIERILREISNA